MTATLTDRYIAATVRSLPESLQAEVRDELRASIADAVDARTENGEPLEEAERAVLTELGDPGVLAAGYADRPLHLIGPKYYLTWLRLLRLLLWIVPFCVAGAVLLGLTISNAPVPEIIGQTVSVTLTVTVHLCFWTTLVFVVLERTGADTGVAWNVDMLPESTEAGLGRGDLIGSIVMLVLTAGAVLWDRFIGFVLVADGEVDISQGLGGQTSPMAVLNPELWPWVSAVFFVLLGAEGALAFFVYGRGRWTIPLAVVNTVLAAIFVVGAITLLATGQLLNPEFLSFVADAGGDGFAAGDAESAGQGGTFRILAVLLGAIIISIGEWDAIDGWRKTRRARIS